LEESLKKKIENHWVLRSSKWYRKLEKKRRKE
jgi:hypothetical protein